MDVVRTAFFIGELNDLDVMTADVGNAYLHAYTKEKVYTVAGPRFGDLEGWILIIVRALYGLKTSMARWHEALSDKLRLFGFKSSKADLTCGSGMLETIMNILLSTLMIC